MDRRLRVAAAAVPRASRGRRPRDGGAVLARHHLFRYETRHQPLLPRRAFLKRLALNFAIATLLVGLSLGVGIIGYHSFEGMAWIDAFANAAMILSGMGPLGPLQTWDGKLFAGLYALYSGLVLIAATGIIFAPLVHRLLHHFHTDVERGDQ
jgi:hypothetical protein